jgi:hypothetical protein
MHQKYLTLTISGLSLATAICAGISARYWLLASRQKAVVGESPTASIGDNPEVHVLGLHVSSYALEDVLLASSRLNKVAAKWSAAAAGLGAVAAGLSAIAAFLSTF